MEKIFSFENNIQSIANNFGDLVWLKIERNLHELQAYASGDGNNWKAAGNPINVHNLDKVQPNYNSWVGTSIGLFTERKSADFDWFICKDGFSKLPSVGMSNFYGVEKPTKNL
jgi:beta-xylosidase